MVPLIRKKDGRVSVTIAISGDTTLPTAQDLLRIEVVEPNFKVKIRGKQMKFATRALRKPELTLAKFAALEYQAARKNKKINLNETVEVKLAIQNVGDGIAENIGVQIENKQKGVMFLGTGSDLEKMVRKAPWAWG